jgi:xylulokinase
VDIGTTAAKAVLVSHRGELVAEAECSYCTSMRPDGIVEQDPESWWMALRELMRDLIRKKPANQHLTALGLATQGGTLVPLDHAGVPTRMAITWLDRRAADEGRRLNQQYGEEFFYRRTGWKLRSGSPLLETVWLRAHDAASLERCTRIAFVNDYLIHRLTGHYCSDPSNCCVTMLYNVREGRWDPELLKIAGIAPHMLSPVRPSGSAVGALTAAAATELGLPSTVTVCNGVHDQYGASVGAGAYHSGDLLISCGTAWALVLTAERPVFDFASGVIAGAHALAGKWGEMAAISNAGVSMEWYKQIREWTDSDSERRFHRVHTEQAARVAPGCDGLLFLPHFGGSTAPTWEPLAQGGFVGLRLGHSGGHLYRAIMEGLALETRWNVQNLEGLGFQIERLVVIGGAARSPLWPQIIADATGKPVRVIASANVASVGAALIAGAGCGIFSGVEAGWTRLNLAQEEILPSERCQRAYRELFQVYRSVFQDLVQWRKDCNP